MFLWRWSDNHKTTVWRSSEYYLTTAWQVTCHSSPIMLDCVHDVMHNAMLDCTHDIMWLLLEKPQTVYRIGKNKHQVRVKVKPRAEGSGPHLNRNLALVLFFNSTLRRVFSNNGQMTAGAQSSMALCITSCTRSDMAHICIVSLMLERKPKILAKFPYFKLRDRQTAKLSKF